MRDKKFWKKLSIGLLILVIALVILFFNGDAKKVELWVNVGCSILASALVIVVTELFELFNHSDIDPLQEWGIKNVYEFRKVMNIDTEKDLKCAKKEIDVIGFGLRSFRDAKTSQTINLLQNGVNIRILTMDPNSPFIKQREIEEKVGKGHIKQSINELVSWANDINEKSNGNGKIQIKGYKCMTLDFYWRVDDVIYIGPYLYGKESQNTISYKIKEGKAAKIYKEYFDGLWRDTSISRDLTK